MDYLVGDIGVLNTIRLAQSARNLSVPCIYYQVLQAVIRLILYRGLDTLLLLCTFLYLQNVCTFSLTELLWQLAGGRGWTQRGELGDAPLAS